MNNQTTTKEKQDKTKQSIIEKYGDRPNVIKNFDNIFRAFN